jgi:hypothetical protein
LRALGGGLGGSRVWKSNNPEKFTGNGWLMQSARNDASRGGSATPLSGTFPVYAFHINDTGGTRYLHVLVTNPQSGSVTVSARGSMYTSSEHPLGGAAQGLDYKVARDWLDNTLRTNVGNTSVGSGQAMQVYRATLGHGKMVDGRFEVTASAGVYVYTVVTSSGSLTDAVNASQAGPAAGHLAYSGTNAYGREAGVYAESQWTGTTDIDVPAAPAHLGLALNTSAKFAVNGVFLQEQASPYVMRLDGMAERTFANYGHYYDVTLALHNNGGSSRTVRLSMASNVTGSSDSPSFTYNGPISLNGTRKDIYTRPTAPKNVLATWTVAPGDFNARIRFYVPGLITIGAQLILESL